MADNNKENPSKYTLFILLKYCFLSLIQSEPVGIT